MSDPEWFRVNKNWIYVCFLYETCALDLAMSTHTLNPSQNRCFISQRSQMYVLQECLVLIRLLKWVFRFSDHKMQTCTWILSPTFTDAVFCILIKFVEGSRFFFCPSTILKLILFIKAYFIFKLGHKTLFQPTYTTGDINEKRIFTCAEHLVSPLQTFVGKMLTYLSYFGTIL